MKQAKLSREDPGPNGDARAAVRIAKLATETRAEAAQAANEEIRETLLQLAVGLDRIVNQLARPRSQ